MKIEGFEFKTETLSRTRFGNRWFYGENGDRLGMGNIDDSQAVVAAFRIRTWTANVNATRTCTYISFVHWPACRLSGRRARDKCARSGSCRFDSTVGRARVFVPIDNTIVSSIVRSHNYWSLKKQIFVDKDQKCRSKQLAQINLHFVCRPADKDLAALIRRKIPLDRLRPVARYHWIRINYCRAINLHIFIHVPADDD